MPRTLTILTRSQGAEIDGIRDHASALAAAVSDKEGWQARCLDLAMDRPRDLAAAMGLQRPLSGGQTVLVEYNPFSFGRRGIAPWLPRALAAFRRANPAVQLAVLVHEPFVPRSSLKLTVLHGVQHAQLDAVTRLADVRLATTARWARLIRGGADVLPVGSNLPDRRSERAASRRRLGVGPSTAVLAAFGTNHPSRLPAWLEAGFDAASAVTPDVLALNLGAGAPSLSVEPCCIGPGPLEAARLAEHLAASDLFLAPFVDGVSTRRTTVMAALQHGLTVLGTRGTATGPELTDSAGLILVDVDDIECFTSHARRLAADRSERERRGTAARRLYDARFDWPVLAERLTGILGAVPQMSKVR